MFSRTFATLNQRRLVASGFTAVGIAALIAVLALALVSLNARAALGSGSGGGGCFSTTGPACTFSGHSANAQFSSVASDGCTVTDAFVSAFDNFTNPGRAASQSVSAAINIYNACTGVPLLSVSNFDPNTGMSNFTGTIKFSTDLSSASVNGSATMYDFLGGSAPFTSTINISWSGFGAISTFMDNSHFRAPGFMMNSHFTGVSREAEASGVLTDASGTNYATPASIFSSLENSRGGTVQFARN